MRGEAGEGLADESALERPKLLWVSQELIEGEMGDLAMRSDEEVGTPFALE